MSRRSRSTEIGGGASLDLPPGWIMEPDREDGVNISAEDGVGLLHLVAFDQAAGEALDPAEELYSFLEDQGIELEDDDVEDVELEGDGAMLAICEYITEEDEEGRDPAADPEDEELATFWLVGVATAPGNLLFGSYSCPAGQEAAERDSVRDILSSLRLRARH